MYVSRLQLPRSWLVLLDVLSFKATLSATQTSELLEEEVVRRVTYPSPVRLSHEHAPRCSMRRDIVSAERSSCMDKRW